MKRHNARTSRRPLMENDRVVVRHDIPRHLSPVNWPIPAGTPGIVLRTGRRLTTVQLQPPGGPYNVRIATLSLELAENPE